MSYRWIRHTVHTYQVRLSVNVINQIGNAITEVGVDEHRTDNTTEGPCRPPKSRSSTCLPNGGFRVDSRPRDVPQALAANRPRFVTRPSSTT